MIDARGATSPADPLAHWLATGPLASNIHNRLQPSTTIHNRLQPSKPPEPAEQRRPLATTRFGNTLAADLSSLVDAQSGMGPLAAAAAAAGNAFAMQSCPPGGHASLAGVAAAAADARAAALAHVLAGHAGAHTPSHSHGHAPLHPAALAARAASLLQGPLAGSGLLAAAQTQTAASGASGGAACLAAGSAFDQHSHRLAYLSGLGAAMAAGGSGGGSGALSLGQQCSSRGAAGQLQSQQQQQPASAHCLFVYNLAPEMEESMLWKLFGPFGAVQQVNLVRDSATNKCKGFAFVTMTDYSQALTAVQSLNGCSLANRVLQVSFKTTSSKVRRTQAPPSSSFAASTTAKPNQAATKTAPPEGPQSSASGPSPGG